MSLLNVITCDTSCCMLVSQSFQEVFNVAWKLENTVPLVIVLSFHSSATEDVDPRGVVVGVCDQDAILDQWCRQQDCVSAFDAGHWRKERVIAVRQESNVHFEFYLRNVTGGTRTPWKLLCVGVTECTGGGQVA